MDSCQLSNGVLDFKEANQEAILLLNDAHMMAEQKMREEFPDLTKIFSKRVLKDQRAYISRLDNTQSSFSNSSFIFMNWES